MESVPTVSVLAGEVIFKEGDTSNSVYLIISGKVEVSRQKNYKKTVFATQGPNTIFGEMSLIDGKPRSATVTAIERTFCYKCSALGILSEMKHIDRDVYKAMQNFASIIRENNDIKLKDADGKLSDKDIIFDAEVKQPYITKEEVLGNKELQRKVEELSPFIKSMYRILLKNAYDN
jgi:CRP/FNR family cyclic AMP-dependent transcriptional regulator